MTIESKPDLALENGKVSRWNAAFNPVYFSFYLSPLDPYTGRPKLNRRFVVKITAAGITYTGKFYADTEGYARVSVATLVKSIIRPVDNFDHSTVAFFDDSLFSKYEVKVAGEWDDEFENGWGTTTEADTIISEPYFVTYAAKQLGERFGGNMAEHLTFQGGSSAKFLTEFAEPVAWEGLPYDIAFIVGESLQFTNLIARFTTVDINGIVVPEGISLSYLLTESGGLLLNENGGGLVVESSVTGQEQLPTGSGVVRLRVPDVMTTVARIKLEVFYLDGINEVKVTEDKYISTRKACSGDPYVYLKFMNHLGAWDYFRFGYNQEFSGDAANNVIVERPVTDWENDDTVVDVVRKTGTNKITLGAEGLTIDQMKSLTWLRNSIKVQMLTSTYPVKWQTVIVQPGAVDSWQSRKNSGRMKLTIQLPAVNIQTQ